MAEGDELAADVRGRSLPHLTLRSTTGEEITLPALGHPRAVLYPYPMTGRSRVPLPDGWDEIPGARGCTAEACAFRDLHAEVIEAGADIYGLSSQSTENQQEAVARLNLPFPLLSDERLALAEALGLPTFTVSAMRLFERLTMIVAGGVVEHVFHPVPSPDRHAEKVLTWLQREGGPPPLNEARGGP